MANKSTEIVAESGLNPEELVAVLNSALADEYYAWYQYVAGAPIAYGLFRDEVESQMNEHAKEELKHAEWLSKRIIELNGTPLINPSLWPAVSNCGYIEPSEPRTDILVAQVLKAERCAIEVYQAILEKVKGKDPVTFHIIRKILEEEEDHEQDFQDIEDDFKGALSQLKGN